MLLQLMSSYESLTLKTYRSLVLMSIKSYCDVLSPLEKYNACEKGKPDRFWSVVLR